MTITTIRARVGIGFSIGQALLLGAIGCSKSADPSPGSAAPATTGTQPAVTSGAPGAAGAASKPAMSQTAATASNRGATPSASGDVNPGAAAGGIAGSGGPVSSAAGAGATTAGAGNGATGTPPAGGGDVDWTMMGYDPASTYFNRAETTLTKDNAAKLEVLWQKDLGGNVLGGALQVGDKMFATGPSAVYAFDANSGMDLWKVSAPSSSTLGYANGTLYLHTTAGNVVALKAADGSMVWSMKADASGSDGSSSAIPVGGLVLVGGSSGTAELGGGKYRGYMTAMDAMTGANKWTTFTVPDGAIGASFWSTASASMEDGLVFGGTGNNYAPPATDTSDSIIAFDWTTGAIKWKYQRVENDTFPSSLSAPDADFGNNPVLYEAMVAGQKEKLVADGTKYGYVVALKRATGDLVWKRDICKSGSADGNEGLFTNFSYSGKSLMAACNEAGPATLFSLDPATGDILWMRALKGRVFGRMAFANGVGFVGTGEEVEAFDVDTGMTIKSFPSKGGTVASTITISRGRVTFGDGISWLPQGLKAGSTLTVLGLK